MNTPETRRPEENETSRFATVRVGGFVVAYSIGALLLGQAISPNDDQKSVSQKPVAHKKKIEERPINASKAKEVPAIPQTVAKPLEMHSAKPASTDVPQDHWYKEAIEHLLKNESLEGNPDAK